MNKKATGRSQRKGRKGADPFKTIKRIVILLLLVVAAAVFYEIFSDRPGEKKLPPAVSRPVPGKHAPTKQDVPGKAPPGVQETREKGTPAPSREPEKGKPASPESLSGLQVAILIDDIGVDLSSVKNLLKIEAPISFAILPHRPHSVAAAEMIHKAGRDILLHLPMEPHAYPKEKPGPGALFTAMNHEQLKKVLTRNLDSIPHVSGVNNHMGSLFTEDKEQMVVVMKELKDRGLFFIDSRTTSESKAAPASREVGVPFASRQIFIDNEQDYHATRRILMDVLSSSTGSHRGLVLIGHPYAGTIAALEKVVPEWKSRGVLIVPVSHMVQ